MGTRTHTPTNPDEVLDWLSEGRLTPAEAFALFRSLDAPNRWANSQSPDPGSPHTGGPRGNVPPSASPHAGSPPMGRPHAGSTHAGPPQPGSTPQGSPLVSARRTWSRRARFQWGRSQHGEGQRPPAAAPDPALERERRLQAVMNELDGLIGLQSVKQLVKEVHAFVDIQRRRAKEQLVADPMALHMVFKGNPGTGKTTVARVLGRLLKEMEALPKGHLIECERADLVGEYIGHTAQRTREHIRKAMGGILFVDEAYSLARGGEKDFGKEAIDTLVKAMEDHKDEFVVILAGYRAEMEFFLTSNPGLQSRFPIQIEFPDYTSTELLRIAHHICQERQYRLSAAASQRLLRILERQAIGNPYAGNARFVRNVIERAIRRQAVRLVRRTQLTRDDLMTLEATDVWEAAV